jgi:hypothetical protein
MLPAMGQNHTKPWRRLASLRASRRRNTAHRKPPRDPAVPDPLPPLEPPDDDREFLPVRQIAEASAGS